MDALLPHQGGVGGVVATMGTALTDRHVRLLSRYAKEVVLIFDADTAGTMATERALGIFMAQQIHVRVTAVPEGKDPCDFVVARGGEAFASLAAAAPDAMQYIWDKRLTEYQAAGGNLADRRRLVEDFLRLVGTSAAYGAIDEIRRGQLAQHIGHMLNIPPADLQQRMAALTRTVRRPGAIGTGADAVGGAGGGTGGAGGGPGAASQQGLSEQASGLRRDRRNVEEQLLEVLLNRPELFDSVVEKIDPEDFTDPALAQIARTLWRVGHEGRCGLAEMLCREEMSPYSALLARLAAEGARRGNFESDLAGAMEYMAYRRQQKTIEPLRSAAPTDDAALRELGNSLPRKNTRNYPKIT
jgi:DNA primase